MQRTIIADSYSSDKAWIETIPSIFRNEGKTIFKKRNEVKILSHNGKKYVVKHYKRSNIIQRIAYSLYRPSKAERAFRYAERLKQMGLETPAPIAYIELKEKGIFCDAFFVSEYCPLPDCAFLKEQQDKELETALARFIVSMHKKGFLHGDLNLSNILFKRHGDGSFAFSLIDLNRSHFKENPSYRDILKNMMRLTHNSELMTRLVSEYAENRGWDKEKMCRDILHEWQRFCRKKTFIYALKGKKW